MPIVTAVLAAAPTVASSSTRVLPAGLIEARPRIAWGRPLGAETPRFYQVRVTEVAATEQSLESLMVLGGSGFRLSSYRIAAGVVPPYIAGMRPAAEDTRIDGREAGRRAIRVLLVPIQGGVSALLAVSAVVTAATDSGPSPLVLVACAVLTGCLAGVSHLLLED